MRPGLFLWGAAPSRQSPRPSRMQGPGAIGLITSHSPLTKEHAMHIEDPSFPLELTESAQDRVYGACAEEGRPYLRVYVQGGGCSGFSYAFQLEDAAQSEKPQRHVHLWLRRQLQHLTLRGRAQVSAPKRTPPCLRPLRPGLGQRRLACERAPAWRQVATRWRLPRCRPAPMGPATQQRRTAA